MAECGETDNGFILKSGAGEKIVDLAIITPIYNQFVFTAQYIKDLSNLDARHKIILIDNGSTDNSFEKAIELIKATPHECQFMVLHNKENYGFGRGSNRGTKFVDIETKAILFLNNDIRVSKDYLKTWTNSLLEYVDKYENALFSPMGGLIDSNFNFVYETRKSGDKFNYLSGWCLFGAIKTFDKIIALNGDVFDDDFFCYFEDTYLSLQARAAGIHLMMADLPIQHLGRMTGKTMDMGKMYLESREIFIGKCKEKGYKP